MKLLQGIMNHEPTMITGKGIVGMAATGGTFYVSILPEVEAWLRVLSLILGCIVAVLTIFSLVRSLRRASREAGRREDPYGEQ